MLEFFKNKVFKTFFLFLLFTVYNLSSIEIVSSKQIPLNGIGKHINIDTDIFEMEVNKLKDKINILNDDYTIFCTEGYFIDVAKLDRTYDLDEYENVLILLNNSADNLDANKTIDEIFNVDYISNIINKKDYKNIIISNNSNFNLCNFKKPKHFITSIHVSPMADMHNIILTGLDFNSYSEEYTSGIDITANGNLVYQNNKVSNMFQGFLNCAGRDNVYFINNIFDNNMALSGIFSSDGNIFILNNTFKDIDNQLFPEYGLLTFNIAKEITVSNNKFNNNNTILIDTHADPSVFYFENNEVTNNKNPSKYRNFINLKGDNIIADNNIFENNEDKLTLLNNKSVMASIYYKNIFNANNSPYNLIHKQVQNKNTIILDNLFDNNVFYNGKNVLTDTNIQSKNKVNIIYNLDKIIYDRAIKIENSLNKPINTKYPNQIIRNTISNITGLFTGNRQDSNNDSDNNDSQNDSNQRTSIFGGIFDIIGNITGGISDTISSVTESVTGVIGNTIEVITQPIEGTLDAVNYITDINSFVNSIPEDLDISIDSSSKPIYSDSKTENQVNKNADFYYHFKDTKLNTYSPDYIITIKIKNTEKYDLFFNKVSIKEYIGEGLTEPIYSNEDAQLFEEANRNLGEYLNTVYGTLDTEYTQDLTNINNFISTSNNVTVEGEAVTEEEGEEGQNPNLPLYTDSTMVNPNLPSNQQTGTVQTASTIWNGNFIISAENCQDPYYINENSQNLLDLIPMLGNSFNISAGKTCEIQIMFRPRIQAGKYRAVLEIGTATLPDQVDQIFGMILPTLTGGLNDIKMYGGLGSIIIEVDGYAYNEKNLTIDVNNDKIADLIGIRYFDGRLLNPFLESEERPELLSLEELMISYSDNTLNFIQYLGAYPVSSSEIFDNSISILTQTDMDYYYMRPYFVNRYNKDDDKYRKFPKSFKPYYKLRFNVMNLRNSEKVKLIHTLSVKLKDPKIYYENILNGTFRDITEQFNIYNTKSNSLISPELTAMEFYVEDGGFFDIDGVTDGVLRVNALWIGEKGKSLKLGEGMLEEPDTDDLLPEEEDDDLKWGGLPVH